MLSHLFLLNIVAFFDLLQVGIIVVGEGGISRGYFEGL